MVTAMQEGRETVRTAREGQQEPEGPEEPSGAGPAVDGAPRSVPGRARRLRWDDAGMATAEYAIATVAAAGFAGLLIAILRSDEVRGLLLGIVRGALST